MTSAGPATLDALTAAVSDWSTDAADVAGAAGDRSGLLPDGAPRIVVRARSVAEVQATVRFAAEHGIPIVTRGAGSGLAGGAVAAEGQIVLDLSQLDRIVEVRVVDQVAVVEPGVVTADLEAAARQHGLFYAPDPGSVGISTIGGNIATNAGGLRGAKYGVTRDAVLALDVVLADGDLIRVGSETTKGVTGYDLAGLFVGSEGTLGIVVGATVRLLPVQAETASLAGWFPELTDAARAVEAIGRTGVRPTVLEIVDAATLAAIDAGFGTAFRERGGAFLLAQTDGSGAAIDIGRIADAARPYATAVEVAEDELLAADLLAARRLALPAIERLGRVLIEDIAVPRSRLAETIHAVQAIGERHDVRIFVFAHAGDGNVHPIILVPDSPEDGPIPAAAAAAADDIFALALAVGGTVTGEHGVGALKRAWAAREVGPRAARIADGIKALLDPHGILNPGKAI
ncbi:FAD-linked oxidase C-terminal domain-containing protein [Galbitalea sp. SE-J8]|uniref:FAD-binding oxidoreductase n=1 Tax=Galbitalea sp. SE-J8 TaxID=3054952 RepID=UPI00259D2679|nr:FAD-linked oxidase C-terminal domain-containing protein [Galbitalea sp. SE-J8]MDM4761591.1 FAD-linked oxidase C-terminal domain-containing protein [Galbitalea sp. SE-J8]